MLFEEGEFLAYHGKRKDLARLLAVVFATLQEVVPHQTTTARHLTKETFLFGIGSDSELVVTL